MLTISFYDRIQMFTILIFVSVFYFLGMITYFNIPKGMGRSFLSSSIAKSLSFFGSMNTLRAAAIVIVIALVAWNIFFGIPCFMNCGETKTVSQEEFTNMMMLRIENIRKKGCNDETKVRSYDSISAGMPSPPVPSASTAIEQPEGGVAGHSTMDDNLSSLDQLRYDQAGSMTILEGSPIKQDCCSSGYEGASYSSSAYSSSGGCVCLTGKQKDLITRRGGNA